jgi:hypothetical protein
MSDCVVAGRGAAPFRETQFFRMSCDFPDEPGPDDQPYPAVKCGLLLATATGIAD